MYHSIMLICCNSNFLWSDIQKMCNLWVPQKLNFEQTEDGVTAVSLSGKKSKLTTGKLQRIYPFQVLRSEEIKTSLWNDRIYKRVIARTCNEGVNLFIFPDSIRLVLPLYCIFWHANKSINEKHCTFLLSLSQHCTWPPSGSRQLWFLFLRRQWWMSFLTGSQTASGLRYNMWWSAPLTTMWWLPGWRVEMRCCCDLAQALLRLLGSCSS